MLMANKVQKLSTHLLNVAEISEKIIEGLDLSDSAHSIDKSKIMKLAYLAGLFHDIGKVDPVFQMYLNDKTTSHYNPNGVHIEKNKFSFEEHARHNEISWFIIDELFTNKSFGINKIHERILKNAVLWHHSAPIRKNKFESSNIKSSIIKNEVDFKSNLKSILKDINQTVDSDDLDDLLTVGNKDISHYKEFFTDGQNKDLNQTKIDIKCEAIASLIRSVVTTADRHVSASGENFNATQIIDNIFEENNYSNLIDAIEKMEKVFYPETERSKIQENAAIELSNINKYGEIAILNAPAGAGKTKVSLQWIKNSNANKVYYIVPRTIIAEEIFDELKTQYLKKEVSFEIITSDKQLKWTGKKEVDLEDISECYRSDIIITTIDQLIKSTTTHKNISILQDVIQSHVIFDEYHEYYKMSGIDLLFAEIIRLKSFFKNPKTMMMSATPNYFMLEQLLDVYSPSSSNVVSFETTNLQDFNLKYFVYDEESAIPASESLFIKSEDYDYLKNKTLNDFNIEENPFLKKWDTKKTIVISNTATMAQKSYLLNHEDEDSLLAHSKFKQEDKKDILFNIKSNFKSIELGSNVLRSGPIVQASLNITSERLITDLSTPEKIIQRLGRLNRFGEDFKGEFIIAVPYQALDVLQGSEKVSQSDVLSLLRKNDEKESCLLWLDYLLKYMKKMDDGFVFKLKEIYNLYKDFYSDKAVLVELEKELLSSLNKSYKNIGRNILNPVDIIVKKSKKKEDVKIMSKQSLRGKSYNSKMAIYHLENGKLSLTDDYAENVALSRDLILLYDENYHFVKETVKKYDLITSNGDIDKKALSLLKKAKKEKSDKYNAFVLDMARSEKFNILTSLSKKDLLIFNKFRNSEESYVYIKTKKQNIGYVKLKQLTK